MSVRAWPYRTPGEGRVIVEPWLLENAAWNELPGVLPRWDYTTDLKLSRRVNVDVSGCLSDAGLPQNTPLTLCVRARPSTSKIRTRIAHHEVRRNGPIDLVGMVRGSQVAGRLTLETLLELAVDIPESESFSPTLKGSILWRDEVETVLEGSASLLPIAPISFVQAGLPAGAAWYLNIDASQWDWSAMGSLIVLLNSDNPAVAQALREPAAEGNVLDALEVDFVADLVSRALLDEGFWDTYLNVSAARDDDLSLGSLVRALVRNYLAKPSETVEDCCRALSDLIHRDPSMYRARVQEGLGFPRSTN